MNDEICEEYIAPYIRFLKTLKKSENTIRAYRSIIKLMLNYVEKPPEKIEYKDLESYLEFLSIEKQVSTATLYLTIVSLKSYLNFYKNNAGDEIIIPKRDKKIPTYLNDDETHQLLEKSKSSKRGYLVICLLSYTGIRVSELCKLKLEDIDLEDRVIQIRSGKGRKDRIVVVEEKTMNALKGYLKERSEKKQISNYLFCSTKNRGKPISPLTIERLVKGYAEQAHLLKNVTPHVLRHTFATTLLKHGADIRFIQTLLGHASITTTEIYTHIDNKLLHEMYKKTKPRY